MRVAIVHDYIKEYGGAERVLESLHEIYPNAPIYTTVYIPKFLGPHRERFKSASWRRKIKTSWFQYVPFKGKLISPVRLISPFLFKSFDFSRFDVVIASQTGAYFPNMIKKGNAIQICYTHTPPRYLYGYATARDWKKNKMMNILGTLANHFLRMVDYKSSQNVDFFIANSENVRQRIQKFYRRDAKVIYPPAALDAQHLRAGPPVQKRTYYLAGGRIAKPKHIDLIVKAFEELDLPLIVFGRGFAGANLSSPKPNIEFVGEVSDGDKYELMQNAKAYIFASEDEDFGITPVEAMSLGTPVIAYKSGGVLETVVDGKTGVFFEELSVKSLKSAIKRAISIHFEPAKIKEYANKFSEENFKREISKFIGSKGKK